MKPGWVISLALLLLSTMATPAVAAEAERDCAHTHGLSRWRPAGLDKRTPILFVHGINSNSVMTWHNPPRAFSDNMTPTVLPELARKAGGDVWEFDYGKDSLEWVTHPQLGPRLVEAITCLYEEYNGPVPIVAHSMGGLIVRWAANQYSSGNRGSKVADLLGPVLTIGTPNLGSDLLWFAHALGNGADAYAAAVRLSPDPTARRVAELVEAMRSYIRDCGERGNRDALEAQASCTYGGVPLSVLDSHVGAALKPKSYELNNLPRWPDTVAVRQVAGDVELTVGGSSAPPLLPVGAHPGLLEQPPIPVGRVGDVAVSVKSATAGHGGDRVLRCTHHLPNRFSASCWHKSLTYLASAWEQGRDLFEPLFVTLAGTHTLSFARTSCTELVDCDVVRDVEADPQEFVIGDCSGNECTINRPGGVWQAAVPLVFEKGAWRASGMVSLEEGIYCGDVPDPTSFSVELTVISAHVEDGKRVADSLRGLYTETSPPSADCPVLAQLSWTLST